MIINKSYYINLNSRSDRRLQMKSQIGKIPILKQMERYSAINGEKIDYTKEKLECEIYETKRPGFKLGKSMTKGAYGLCQSLLDIYKKNIINNYGNILICEDDCIFVKDFENKFNEYIKHLPQDWDMVHFGYLKSDLVIKEKINEYYSTYEYKPGNQCFLVTKKACEILFENLSRPIQPSDSDMSERVTRKGLLKCYISNERLGYQIDGDDSNTIPKGSKKFYYDKEKK